MYCYGVICYIIDEEGIVWMLILGIWIIMFGNLF